MWGGDRLKEFNYTLQSNHVGECWAVSAHKKGDNLVLSDKYKGLTLSQLYNEHRDIFGNISYEEFPLLTKIIDAKEDLSVQVHPNDEYAMKTENSKYGKTECWYIIDAKSNAKIIIGHNASSKTELKEMINKGEWNNFLREVSVKKGDFFFIPAGTVHAIKGGTLILETQQSSDITSRVYDYDRLQNGKPRELHIKQSIDVIDAPFSVWLFGCFVPNVAHFLPPFFASALISSSVLPSLISSMMRSRPSFRYANRKVERIRSAGSPGSIALSIPSLSAIALNS